MRIRIIRRTNLTLAAIFAAVAIVVAYHANYGNVSDRMSISHRQDAIERIRLFDTAAKIYHTNNGKFPESLDISWLREVISNELSASWLLDPWGNSFQYDPNGPRNQGLKPDIWTVDVECVSADASLGNWHFIHTQERKGERKGDIVD